MVGPKVRGGRLRVRAEIIAALKRARWPCTRCGKKSLRRFGTGLWICRACGVALAGGAYKPETEAGKEARRIIEALK